MNEWINLPSEKELQENIGFIYEITNNMNGRKYIGRKHFWRTEKKKPTKFKMKDGKHLKDKNGKRILNTRTTRTHIKKESDWKTYWGSCNELNEDLDNLGHLCFDRKIIRLCKGRWECGYYEAKEQFDRDVLLSDKFYNGIINCRIRGRLSNESISIGGRK